MCQVAHGRLAFSMWHTTLQTTSWSARRPLWRALLFRLWLSLGSFSFDCPFDLLVDFLSKTCGINCNLSQVDATPFRQWYVTHYGQELGEFPVQFPSFSSSRPSFPPHVHRQEGAFRGGEKIQQDAAQEIWGPQVCLTLSMKLDSVLPDSMAANS